MSLVRRAASILQSAWSRCVLASCGACLVAGMVTDASTVVQQGRAFSTASISVMRGETLHFSNQDDFTHEIYIETPQFSFESDEQEPGTIVAVTFSARGHFPVRCHIHPKMHLDVDVR